MWVHDIINPRAKLLTIVHGLSSRHHGCGCNKGDQGGIAPPMKALLCLRRIEQVGDENAQADALKIRSHLQVLVKRPIECGGYPLPIAV